MRIKEIKMFFSVKHSIRIAGKVYMPCVCYNLTKFLELTVKDLENQGKATIHDKMVFFQNGKIIEEKPVVKENLPTEKPKKEKKTKTVPVKDAEELAAEAEIVPIEKVADVS